MQNFNWVDYVIIGIIGFSIIISFFRGFVREAISLSAWVCGLYVSLKYSTVLQRYLTPWISSEAIRYFIMFVALFILIVLLGILLNILVHQLLHKAGMSMTDRLMGIFFGAARGVAIASVMLLMLMNLGTTKDNVTLKKSELAIHFKPAVLWLNALMPDKIKTVTQWVQYDFHLHDSSLAKEIGEHSEN